jgi:heme oxygenase
MGALYVLAGSALGGRVIARRARALLGPDLPVAFFDSAGRLDSQQHWRALQASLDAFGDTAGATSREQSVAAARQTFRALTGRLDARG